MNNKIELAWAAGFYDGEGSTKRVYYHFNTVMKDVKPTPNRKKAWIYDKKKWT